MLSSGHLPLTASSLSRAVTVPLRDISIFDITDEWNSKSKDELKSSNPRSQKNRNRPAEERLRESSFTSRDRSDFEKNSLPRRGSFLDVSTRREYDDQYQPTTRSNEGFLKSFNASKKSAQVPESFIDDEEEDLFKRSPDTLPSARNTSQQELFDRKVQMRREMARSLHASGEREPVDQPTQDDTPYEIVEPTSLETRRTRIVRTSPLEERLAAQLRSMQFENEEDEEHYLANLEYQAARSRARHVRSRQSNSADFAELDAEIKLRYLPRSSATQRTIEYTRLMRKLVDDREPVAVVGAFLRRFYAMPGLESLLMDVPSEIASLRRILPHRRALRVPKIKTADLKLMKNRLRLIPDAFVFNQLIKSLALEASLALPASTTSVPLPPTPSLPSPKAVLRESAKAALRPTKNSIVAGALDAEEYLPHAHPATIAAIKTLDYMQFCHENPDALAQYIQSFHEKRVIHAEADVEDLATRGIHLERTRRGKVKRFPSLFKEESLAEEYKLRRDALFSVQSPEEIAKEASKRGHRGKAALSNVIAHNPDLAVDTNEANVAETPVETVVQVPSILVDAVAEVHVRPTLSSFVALAKLAAEAGDAILAQALLLRIFHWGLLSDHDELERSKLAVEQLKHLLLIAICDRKSMTVAQARVFFTAWDSMSTYSINNTTAYTEQTPGVSWPSWLWPTSARASELITLPIFANIDFSLPPPVIPTNPDDASSPWKPLSTKNVPAPLVEAMLDACSFSQAWEDAFSTEKTLNFLREQRIRLSKDEKIRRQADRHAAMELAETSRLEKLATENEAQGKPSLRVAEVVDDQISMQDIDDDMDMDMNDDFSLNALEDGSNQLESGVEELESMFLDFDPDADDMEDGLIDIPEDAAAAFDEQMRKLDELEQKQQVDDTVDPKQMLLRANEISAELFKQDYGHDNLLGENVFTLMDEELYDEIEKQQKQLQITSSKFERLQKQLMAGRIDIETFDTQIAELDEATSKLVETIKQLGDLAQIRQNHAVSGNVSHSEESVEQTEQPENIADKRRAMLDLRLRAKKNILEENAAIVVPGMYRNRADLPQPDPTVEIEPNGVFQSAYISLDEMPKSFSSWISRQFDKDTEKSKNDPKSKIPGGIGYVESTRTPEELQERRMYRFQLAMNRRLSLIRRLMACVEAISGMIAQSLLSTKVFAETFKASRSEELHRMIRTARLNGATATEIAEIEKRLPNIHVSDLQPPLPSLTSLSRVLRMNSALTYHSFSFTTAHMDNANEPFAEMVEKAKPSVDKALLSLGTTWGLLSSRAFWLPPKHDNIGQHLTSSSSPSIETDIAEFASMTSIGISKLTKPVNEPLSTELSEAQRLALEAKQSRAAKHANLASVDALQASSDLQNQVSPLSFPLSVHASVENVLSQAPRLRLTFPSMDAIATFSRMRDQYNQYLLQQRSGSRFDVQSLFYPQLVQTSDATPNVVIAPPIKPMGRIILDLGAGDGEHSLHIAMKHPEDIVIANELIEHSAANILFKARVAAVPAFHDLMQDTPSHADFIQRLDKASMDWDGKILSDSTLSQTQPPIALSGDMASSVFSTPIVPRNGEVLASLDDAIPASARNIDEKVMLPGLSNLLVHSGSGSDLLSSFPVNSIDKIIVVHPPPPAMSRKAYAQEVKQRRASAFNQSLDNDSAIKVSGEAPKLVSKKPYEEVFRDSLLSEQFLWLAARVLRPGAYINLQSSDTRVWQWLLEILPPDHVKYATTDAQARDRVHALFDSNLFVQEFGKAKLDTPDESYINRLHRKLSAAPRLSDYFVVQEVFERDSDLGPRSKYEKKNAERTTTNGKRERFWKLIRVERPWV